jgi:transcriptional regulator with XRE-family HTH domain
MDIILKGIGARIRQARLERKLSQANLADMLSISVPYVSDIERGQTNCSVTIFAAIAEALNVSADWLLNINTASSKAHRRNDLSTLLDDCTAEETEIIIKTIKALKASLISGRSNSGDV